MRDFSSSEFVVDVDDEISPGNYSFVFHVVYFNGDREHNKSFVVNLGVNPLPESFS